MKKFLLAIATLFVSLSGSAIGLEKIGIANHLGVGVHAATTGFGFEVATPVTRWVQVRAGMSFMPDFSFSTDADVEVASQYGLDGSVDLKASLKRVQGSLIFNIYPFGNLGSFYVAAGCYFGGSDLIKVTGHSDEYARHADLAEVVIGDYRLPFDKNGDVSGSIKVKSFRPYLGIGWGRPVPNHRINFTTEIGVQFHGTPAVYDSRGKVDLDEYLDSDDDFQKIMDNLKIYPVLKFTLSGKIF